MLQLAHPGTVPVSGRAFTGPGQVRPARPMATTTAGRRVGDPVPAPAGAGAYFYYVKRFPGRAIPDWSS